MTKIENKHFSSKYNSINNYIVKRGTRTFSNTENKITLNNSCKPVAKVLNVKTIKEICSYLDSAIGDYETNIGKLSQLRDYVAANPPISKDGKNPVLESFNTLIGYADNLKSDLNSIGASNLVSLAWTERYKNIDNVISDLRRFRQQEQDWRDLMEKESKSTFKDYWLDGVKDIFS